MKRVFGLLCAVLALINNSTAQFSQHQGNQYIDVDSYVTRADIINASVLVDPLAEKVKDIHIDNFSLRITNRTSQEILANLNLEGWVTLEEDRVREQSVTAVTKKPFKIPIGTPPAGGRMFTSKDADNPGSDIDFDDNVNEVLKKKLKDKILDPASGGRVPSGLYEIKFSITVVSVGGNPVNTDAANPLIFYESVNVTNPTTAVLDVPFTNGYVYPTPFPQFQWTYDTRGVKISVYEKRPEQQSLEDVISASDPYWVVNINRKSSGNRSTITYPQTTPAGMGINDPKDDVSFGSPRPRGPRQLERGKMYVVVLDGITTAFGFEVDPLRTLRSFVISDPQGQVVLNILQTTFSGGQFQNIFNIVQDQNWQINTNSITLNGIRITPQDLQRLLTENKDRITSVRIEE